MSSVSATAIDVIETAYDLSEAEAEYDWENRLLASFLPIVDRDRGLVGVNYWRKDGEIRVVKVHVASGPSDLAVRKARLVEESPPSVLQACTRPGYAGTFSELTTEFPGAMSIFREHMVPMVDALGINAVDPDGQGLVIIAGRDKAGGITKSMRYRLQQMAAHFSAGHRLRRGLLKDSRSELPLGGEAVLDPKDFKVDQAQGALQDSAATTRLREAARQVDRARGQMRRSDPETALEIWKGLVEGRWSLVDWFDSDGRRFVVARPNAPDVGDPRGLTTRERQVATFAALGESSKLISYRLGLAKSTVSEYLASAKKKLGVRSQTQLVERLRGPQGAYGPDDAAS